MAILEKSRDIVKPISYTVSPWKSRLNGFFQRFLVRTPRTLYSRQLLLTLRNSDFYSFSRQRPLSP